MKRDIGEKMRKCIAREMIQLYNWNKHVSAGVLLYIPVPVLQVPKSGLGHSYVVVKDGKQVAYYTFVGRDKVPCRKCKEASQKGACMVRFIYTFQMWPMKQGEHVPMASLELLNGYYRYSVYGVKHV